MYLKPKQMRRTLTFYLQMECEVCKGTIDMRYEVAAVEFETRLNGPLEERVAKVWQRVQDQTIESACEQRWVRTVHDCKLQQDTWVCPGTDEAHKQARIPEASQ